jgi:hypothetical protein
MRQQLITNQKENRIEAVNALKIHKVLAFYKKNWLRRGFLLPDLLIEELEAFTHRNALAKEYDSKNHKDVHVCCQQCLKAHALKKARELNLHPKLVVFLEKIFEGEIGHNSYYTDSENLIKL